MEKIIQFDDSWSDFVLKLNSQPISDYEQACELTGISFNYFKTVVEHSIENWRDSTTTSLLNGLSNLSLDTVPHGNMFDNYIWQTRFIFMALKNRLLNRMDIVFIREKGQPLLVKGSPAQSVNSVGEKTLNKIVKALYIYWFVNQKKTVKLPKFIYRGIRAHNLFENKNITLKNAIDAIWKADGTHAMKRKQAIDILIEWICKVKLSDIVEEKLLSFSSNIGVAKYFSNGEGFCLRVDPKKVKIITSEIHDAENVGGADPFDGKKEYEYIIKIPDNYNFTKDDIIINDVDYFVASQNPLSVGLLDHDNKKAVYKMDGIEIEAYFRWNYGGTSGGIVYSKKGDWNFLSRLNFKKNFGFDPLPNEKNLASITDFEILPRKQW